LAVAFFGGVISFASPCVLPIVPGFLTIITGLDITSETKGQSLSIARDTGLFILGFGVVFVALGAGASTFGSVLFQNQRLLAQISGALILAMALYLLGSLFLKAPWLYQEKRFHPQLRKYGPFAAPIAGVAFGFGWTPCIGPVLTAVLALAATQDTAGQGAALLAAYTVGLGLPFLITALAFGRVAGAFKWVKQHLRGVTIGAASLMGAFGILLLSNRLTDITVWLFSFLESIGLEELTLLG